MCCKMPISRFRTSGTEFKPQRLTRKHATVQTVITGKLGSEAKPNLAAVKVTPCVVAREICGSTLLEVQHP